MKKLIFFVFLISNCLMAETFYVINDKVEVFDPKSKQKIGTMARGTFGEKVKDDGEKIVLKIKGYVKSGDSKTLYATKNTTMPLVVFDKTNKETTLDIAIAKDKVSTDQAKAWADAEFLYYDSCSMCHAAHAPKEHNMLEWDGIFNTMRAFAMPTDEEADAIIQYLRAHAIDGYATDDEEEEEG